MNKEEKSPFYYGKTIAEPGFIDRTREIAELSHDLARGQNIILFSPRRYGKTSLIRTVERALHKRGIIACYLDLYRITSLAEFSQLYARMLAGHIRSPLQKTIDLLVSLLPSLQPKLIISAHNEATVEIGIDPKQLAHPKPLAELFDAFEQYLRSKRKRGCVIFDEFQELALWPEGDLLQRTMRSAFQHHTQIGYAFLGSKMHLMQHLFRDKRAPFYNFGNHVELGVIPAKEWHPFIRRAFATIKRRLTPALIEKICTITEGHPYYTQFLCSELWWIAQTTKHVDTEHVEHALECVLQKESHAFGEIWDTLSTKQRHLIRAISADPTVEIFSGNFLARYQFGSVSSVQRLVASLVTREILSKRDRTYRLHDPIFARWTVQKPALMP